MCLRDFPKKKIGGNGIYCSSSSNLLLTRMKGFIIYATSSTLQPMVASTTSCQTSEPFIL